MEVERALIEASNEALSEAVVSVRQSSPDSPQSLVAHVVFDQNHPRDERAQVLDSVHSCLGLPRYMCPSAIVPLDQMPLTNTLKLDRRAIAAFPLPKTPNAQPVEMSENESQLRKIWEEVIYDGIPSLHNVQSSTDFFHVGGTSLFLLDLRQRIQRQYHIRLQLSDMFNASTLASMAVLIENRGKQSASTTRVDWDLETDLPPAS
jgi:hybrid polyketide synthase/nonribosomal peptide synthetase ACE1